MTDKKERDEYLERLWHMKEDGMDSLDDLLTGLNGSLDTDVIDELFSDNLVEIGQETNRIALTKQGGDLARRLIRAHRLAERLLYDVLGGEDESAACEFEHTMAHEMVDSICILLGHPRECPHGLPIPEGDCCRRAVKTLESSVVPLTELSIGQSARVAYVNCKNDRQIHRMDGLQIRPGAIVKLHQKYPSHVIECENTTIALDEYIASSVCMWKTS